MTDISFLQVGEGKDLVFLHGYLSCKESFAPQIAYFSKFYRVTAFDFPGFGKSGPIPFAYTVEDYANRTEDFLRERGIFFPHVVAHSFGGRVAVKCLSRGAVFDRAVLCGCAGILPRRTFAYRMRVKAYRAVKRIAPAYAETHFGSAEYRSLSPVMRESYKKIVNEDLREDAKRISRPVLFVCGDRDRETPVSSAEIYRASVEGSRLLVLENCGHFAHLDDVIGFNLAAEEFFGCGISDLSSAYCTEGS